MLSQAKKITGFFSVAQTHKFAHKSQTIEIKAVLINICILTIDHVLCKSVMSPDFAVPVVFYHLSAHCFDKVSD